MPRTTINIDAPILNALKKLRRTQKKSLGQLISELVAEALTHHESQTVHKPGFSWTSQPMDSRLDIADKEALYSAMDQDGDVR